MDETLGERRTSRAFVVGLKREPALPAFQKAVYLFVGGSPVLMGALIGLVGLRGGLPVRRGLGLGAVLAFAGLLISWPLARIVLALDRAAKELRETARTSVWRLCGLDALSSTVGVCIPLTLFAMGYVAAAQGVPLRCGLCKLVVLQPAHGVFALGFVGCYTAAQALSAGRRSRVGRVIDPTLTVGSRGAGSDGETDGR